MAQGRLGGSWVNLWVTHEIEPETSMASIEPGGEPFRPRRCTVAILWQGMRSLGPAEQRARLSTLGLLGDELLHALHARKRSATAVSRDAKLNEPDHRHRRLLCTRCQRPRDRRAVEQRAADHSITSSARASSVGGTSRPSALAVIRLMTNSNLVDCKTGRSAGFAPLRS